MPSPVTFAFTYLLRIVYAGRPYFKNQQVRGQAHCPFRVVIPFPSKIWFLEPKKGQFLRKNIFSVMKMVEGNMT